MKNLQITNSADTLEIDIFGDIGESWFSEGNTMQSVRGQIEGSKAKSIVVNISSLGGSVWDGLAIHDILAMHPANVETRIIGATASMGTIVALAGNTVKMSDNALFLVHNASTIAMGNKYDLEEAVKALKTVDERLKNIYKKKTSKEGSLKTLAQIEDLMKQERWIDAKEAKTFGFVNEVFEPKKIAAHYSDNVKKELLNKINGMKFKEVKDVIGEFEISEGGAFLNEAMLEQLNAKIAEPVQNASEVDIAEAVAYRENELKDEHNALIVAKVGELEAAQALLDAKELELTAMLAEKEVEAAKVVEIQARFDTIESELNQKSAKLTAMINEPSLAPKELTEKEKLQAQNAKHVAENINKFK